jgi:hypothetical protein
VPGVAATGGGAGFATALDESVDGVLPLFELPVLGGGALALESAEGGAGGAAAVTSPARKASALYWAWVRSATRAFATCFCSSEELVGGALPGVSASAGY